MAIQFIFKITDVNKELLVKAPYAALDGNLTILINDSAFFSEEGISLIDLALCITGWLNEVEAEFFTDFDYSSDEYQENPVLYFAKIDNQHHYTVRSAWVEFHADTVLNLEEIVNCFTVFLTELDSTIKQKYGAGFADMPLFKLVTKPRKSFLKRIWSYSDTSSTIKDTLARLIYPA